MNCEGNLSHKRVIASYYTAASLSIRIGDEGLSNEDWGLIACVLCLFLPPAFCLPLSQFSTVYS